VNHSDNINLIDLLGAATFLSRSEAVLLEVILRHVNDASTDYSATIPYSTLSAEAEYAPFTLRLAARSLQKKGLLTRTVRRIHTTFTVDVAQLQALVSAEGRK
jgi:hypothetical protein